MENVVFKPLGMQVLIKPIKKEGTRLYTPQLKGESHRIEVVETGKTTGGIIMAEDIKENETPLGLIEGVGEGDIIFSQNGNWALVPPECKEGDKCLYALGAGTDIGDGRLVMSEHAVISIVKDDAIIPLSNKLIISEKKVDSPIIGADELKPKKAIVKEVGRGITYVSDAGTWLIRPLTAQKGDEVLVEAECGLTINFNGSTYKIITQDNILGILKKAE